MRLSLCILVAGMISCAGCSQDELPDTLSSVPKPPVINLHPVEAKKPPRFVYAGDRFRDPFVSLNGDGMAFVGTDEVIVPSVGSLVLKGIFSEGKQRMAIISSGAISYVLKGKYLYDNRQRLVRGITGIIKDESVVIIAPDRSTKEIRLRDRQ